MIGKRDIVEIIVFVIRIERAPSAVFALHPQNPFACHGNRRTEVALRVQALRAIHRHHHHRRVVDIGIVRIGVLEGPAAGPDIGPPRDPIAFDIEDLLRRQPLQTFAHLRYGLIAAALEQAVTGERRIPNRRNARLAIGLVLVHDEKLLDGFARDRALGMMLRIAKSVEHHHAVGYRRENRAQTILAVETLRYPRGRAVGRALPQAAREHGHDKAKDGIDAAEQPKPRRLLLRRLRREADSLRRLEEELFDRDPLRVASSGLQRHQHQ